MRSKYGLWAGGFCGCSFICILIGLALTTGGVFLSFYVGWAVQQTQFVGENSVLAGNYSALFAVPAVAEPWPVFSCFLYGALILAAVGIGLVLVLACLSCCCGLPLLACCCAGGSDMSTSGEWTELMMPKPTMRSYNSF